MSLKRRRGIPEAKPLETDQLPIRFSFKHLDLENEKFNHAKCDREYFRSLFQVLQRFSSWEVGDFTDQNNNEHRHHIHFPETTEPNGFTHIQDPEQLGYAVGWQFSPVPDDPGCRWRVHGILIDDTFFVVWLDMQHLLYA